jgi:peptide-methionine (S)-S-oxide reductase
MTSSWPQSSVVDVTAGSETAIFAAGCFWGVEHMFKKHFIAKRLDTGSGVLSPSDTSAISSIEVGYIGGDKLSADYKSVCSGTTGHAEAVRIVFEPSKVSYRTLVEFFFRTHDFTTLDKQGPDIGAQYRSAIFCTTPTQQLIASDVLRRVQVEWIDVRSPPSGVKTSLPASSDIAPVTSLTQKTKSSDSIPEHHTASDVIGSKIVTTISMAGEWFMAEEYHQRYLEVNPDGYECPSHRVRAWPLLHKPDVELRP